MAFTTVALFWHLRTLQKWQKRKPGATTGPQWQAKKSITHNYIQMTSVAFGLIYAYCTVYWNKWRRKWRKKKPSLVFGVSCWERHRYRNNKTCSILQHNLLAHLKSESLYRARLLSEVNVLPVSYSSQSRQITPFSVPVIVCHLVMTMVSVSQCMDL